jgi:hypothetical protein
VQIDFNQLKTNYPELTTYLLKRSNETTTPIPKTTKYLTSKSIQNAHLTSKIRSSTSTIDRSTRKKLPYTPPITKTTVHLQRTTSIRSSQISTTTPETANEFLFFNNVTKKFEGVSIQSTYSILRLTPSVNFTIITTTPEIVPLTTEVRKSPLPARTTPVSRLSNPLSRTTTTPIQQTTRPISSTTSPVVQASRNFLPLYHQFIYTVKLPNQAQFVNNKNILDLLYEQNVASSRLRVSLMRAVADQLGFNLSSLRLNWIEIVNSKLIESMNDENDVKTTTQPITTRPIHLSNLDEETYFNTDILNSAELYYYDSRENTTLIPLTTTAASQSSNELRQQRIQEQRETEEEKQKQKARNFYHVLVSFSSTNLFDLQKMFLINLKQQSMGKVVTNEMIGRLNSIKAKFESECEEFFTELKAKHEENIIQFKLGLLSLTKDFQIDSKMADSREEYLKKVQFLKLCDLNEIYKILLFNANNKNNKTANMKQDLANSYIKNSTEELVFNQIEITTDETDESEEADFETDADTETEPAPIAPKEPESIILNKSVEKDDRNETILIKFKSNPAGMSANETTSEDSIFSSSASFIARCKLFFNDKINSTKNWFWKVVPEEDFLLAVIVPVIIIVAMIILTIVVTCLLHMCNKEYKNLNKQKSKKHQSRNNLQQENLLDSPITTATHSVASPKTPSHGTLSKSNNPIYKQRAYLSKGVPVILYEEMSDKVINIHIIHLNLISH